MNGTEIRTRIAPSPTGRPHIGTAYIALFNYAFAKSNGGKFILRIEDTDRARSTRESEDAIYDALKWVGIPWDEGPDIGGPFGSYRQSERLDIYKRHCAELVEKGHAYPCFCTAERLTELRKQQSAAKIPNPGYDGLCAGISKEEANRRIAAGEPHVIRMKVPREGECVFKDRIRGEVKIPWAQVDQQVLLKTDGFPTYHLAVVVDDHLMRITHVIRGEEWISSTPKHVLLYEYFSWQPPEFVHLPLLRNPDKSKLSKRKNPTSVIYYRDSGFLSEALVNYLGLMAYSLPDGREIFSLNDMIDSFDIGRISMGGPIFDLIKLTNFNGQYMRKMTPAQLMERARAWKVNDDAWLKILPLAQPRLNRLTDLVPMAAFIFADKMEYAPTALISSELDGEKTVRLLKIAQWEFEKLPAWNLEAIKSAFAKISEKEVLKLKSLMTPFFVALSGSSVSLPAFESMEIIGRDMVLRRIQYAIEALATAAFELKGKSLKELESHYETTYR
jgi:glutamyl-tRNA synthetase